MIKCPNVDRRVCCCNFYLQHIRYKKNTLHCINLITLKGLVRMGNWVVFSFTGIGAACSS